jgi:hypothetical protein
MSALQGGGNSNIYTLWDQLTQSYPGLTNQGIWGDKSHQARKSDHNTGDAIDIGVPDIQGGTSIADEILKMAPDRNVKYVIFNRQIWNPAQGWHPYKGENPHDQHIHVSFNPVNGEQTAPPPVSAPPVAQLTPMQIAASSLADTFTNFNFEPTAQKKLNPLAATYQPPTALAQNPSIRIAQNLPSLFFGE